MQIRTSYVMNKLPRISSMNTAWPPGLGDIPYTLPLFVPEKWEQAERVWVEQSHTLYWKIKILLIMGTCILNGGY